MRFRLRKSRRDCTAVVMFKIERVLTVIARVRLGGNHADDQFAGNLSLKRVVGAKTVLAGGDGHSLDFRA